MLKYRTKKEVKFMSQVRKFLSKIEQEDINQYFRLYKFYLNPKVSLGGNDESTLEEYYEFGDIKHFILNNTFFQFLRICLQDKRFTSKLDLTLLSKIRFILYDSKEFKREYFIGLEDKYLREWCKNQVPLVPIYSKKYNIYQLIGIATIYKKYGWIYELELNKEQIEKLNIEFD